jgi:hypothetical protein
MNHQDDNSPLSGNDRLDDALLHEHARAGTGSDEAFLTQVEKALDAESDRREATHSVKSSRNPHRIFWTLAKVALVMLAVVVAGLLSAPMVIRQRKKADQRQPYMSMQAHSYELEAMYK